MSVTSISGMRLSGEGRWKPNDPDYSYRLLRGLSVGVMGASGAIGQVIARICQFFGMKVRGLASHRSNGDSGQRDTKEEGKERVGEGAAVSSSSSSPSTLFSAHSDPIAWFYTSPPPDGVGPAVIPPLFLHGLDYLVSVLPSTPSTRWMLGGEGDGSGGGGGVGDVLRHCRKAQTKLPHTVLINIGRGDVISEAALLRALLGSDFTSRLPSPHSPSVPVPGADAFIAGAVLDVFVTEPLPSSHAFYSLAPPLLTVTPHVSGLSGAAKQEIVQLFIDNLHRWTQQRPLLHEVDKERGY